MSNVNESHCWEETARMRLKGPIENESASEREPCRDDDSREVEKEHERGKKERVHRGKSGDSRAAIATIDE